MRPHVTRNEQERAEHAEYMRRYRRGEIPSRRTAACGTDSGHQRHRRAKEEPCEACKNAHAAYVVSARLDWETVDGGTWTADRARWGPFIITACLDDEGPQWPAYFWELHVNQIKIADGWSSSERNARIDALVFAQALTRGAT
jgi:hypothetical protein